MPLQPPLTEKLVGLLFLLLQGVEKSNTEQALGEQEIHSQIPFKYDKKLAMIETKWKGFFFSLTLVQVYLFCTLSIHTPVIQIL